MLYIVGVDDVSAPATAFSVGIRVLVQLEQPGRSVLAVRQRAVRLRARLPSQVLLRMLHSLTAAHDDQPPTLPHQCIRMHTHDSSDPSGDWSSGLWTNQSSVGRALVDH